MSVIDTLIYDRTQADVTRRDALAAKGLSGMTEAELAEWRAGMKGAYNATDLNRVTDALHYLQEELTGYGYAVTVAPIVIHHSVIHWVTDENGQVIVDEEGYATIDHIEEWDDTTWIEWDIPTIQQMQTYLNNVAAIRGVLDVFENTPQTPPTMNKLTFQRANDIEKILSDVQKAIDRVVAGFRLSNAFTMVSGSMHLPSLPLAEVTFSLAAVNGEALLTNTGTPIYAVYKRNFKEILTRKGGQT